jgi:dGTPase
MLEDLFLFYLKNPSEIGGQARKRERKEGRHRVICDYIAGMTDRYVMLEYQRLIGRNRED